MPACRAVQQNLTAWIDGELSGRWVARVDAHLARCVACARNAVDLRAAVALQRQALPQLLAEAAVDPGPLWEQLRRRVAAQTPAAAASRGPGWSWLFRPMALAGAAVAVALVIFFEVVGGPKEVLIPLGVEAPPAAISKAPDLFKDYPIIQHLDALENFDTVESEPLDDDQGSHKG